MIVLNGAAGLSEALAQALSQGVAGLQMAPNLLAGPTKTAESSGTRVPNVADLARDGDNGSG